MVKSSITVLGVHDGHDAGAAIVRDGKVMAAIAEERIRNVKHYSGTPIKSIEEVLKISKVNPSEVDMIAIGGLVRVHAPLKEYPLYVKLYEKLSPITARPFFTKHLISFLHKFRKLDELKKVAAELGIQNAEITFVEHHLAHAATAYYSSPWNLDEKVLVLTADGAGDGISSTVSIGHKGEIKRIGESIYYHSLGNVFYSEITRYLGMVPWDHEYKVMGLAPYGKGDYCIDKIKRIIDIDEANPLRFKNKTGAYTWSVQKKLKKLLDGQRFDNIAAATQTWFEHLITTWVRSAIAKTDIRKIACAGGLFLNVKANKQILALEDIEDIFFYPASGDDGLAVGAALQGYFQVAIRDGKRPIKAPITDIYYGTSFTNDYIKNVLKESGLLEKAKYIDRIDEEVGEMLSKSNMVIARFSGGMEWGPRGLGNRSIIANPSDVKTIRKINYAIKMRDFWMPFAPSILTSRINDYVVNGRVAPYMILAFDSTDKRDELAAGIHPYDLSCRPQTVDSNYNPAYEQVLKSFENKTGIGAVLNTSFNLHGYPIVHSPEIAIWTFKNSALDALALGNYLIQR